MNNENRKYGIEIEAYNIPKETLASALSRAGIDVRNEHYNHNTRSYWKIVDDSSIRGIYRFELVSPPLKGNNGLKELKKVCEVLNNLNAKVNRSCGLHVHHDASDFGTRHFVRLFNLYKNAETAIDSLIPISRRANNNIYCRSLRGRSNYSSYDRQSKLNFNAFERHGTVEFRHHSGTVDYEKISNWVKLTQLMMEDAKNNSSVAEELSWDSLKSRLNMMTSATSMTFKNNVGGYIMKNLVSGTFRNVSNSVIAEMTKEKFQNAKTTAKSVAWYKHKLNKEGLLNSETNVSNELGTFFDSRREALI